MLDLENDVVRFKLQFIDKLLPASSAVVFGDMYRVEGGYTLALADRGVPRVLLVDTLETPAWLEARLRRPQVDFAKGDFSDALFMRSLRERFEVAVVYDVLLHQPPLLHTINLMLRLTERKIAIVQPMLRERELQNSLVYLPGNTDKALYPPRELRPEFAGYDIKQVHHAHWQWGMTASFLASALVGEGFAVTASAELGSLPNPIWYWYGCIAERVEDVPGNWSRVPPTPGLYTGGWD